MHLNSTQQLLTVMFLQKVLCKTKLTFYARRAGGFLDKILKHVSGCFVVILIFLHFQGTMM